MLIRVVRDPEPPPGTRWEYTLDGPPVHHTAPYKLNHTKQQGFLHNIFGTWEEPHEVITHEEIMKNSQVGSDPCSGSNPGPWVWVKCQCYPVPPPPYHPDHQTQRYSSCHFVIWIFFRKKLPRKDYKSQEAPYFWTRGSFCTNILEFHHKQHCQLDSIIQSSSGNCYFERDSLS